MWWQFIAHCRHNSDVDGDEVGKKVWRNQREGKDWEMKSKTKFGSNMRLENFDNEALLCVTEHTCFIPTSSIYMPASQTCLMHDFRISTEMAKNRKARIRGIANKDRS